MLRFIIKMLFLLTATYSGLLNAQSLELTLTVPRLQVAEYHRPYIAIWVARADKSVARNLAVLYDLEMEDDEGKKWLKDLRQWWRRSGRSLDMPVDGLSGATRVPGQHQWVFQTQLSGLEAGDYSLVVEAAREVGGRELLSLPFQWPPTEEQRSQVQGQSELGELKLRVFR
ncbi:MAG: DUF2271 domain-containing protein [Parahaliea sp.]